MSTPVAALIAVAAMTVTYFSCVRPMLRGRGHCGMPGDNAGHGTELDRQIADLREEVRLLRVEDSLASDRAAGGASVPPTEV